MEIILKTGKIKTFKKKKHLKTMCVWLDLMSE